MQKDALAYTKKCDKCQKHSPIIHLPGTKLTPLTSPWPFAQWGMDILGPFPRASGSRRFLLVATDYFTKWTEAVALVNIADSNVKTFLWENIVTRFGIPKILVSDNGPQFKSKKILDFCQKLGIRQSFSSVAHPETNGQAESSNKVILEGLKKRLEDSKGKWADELPSVLWAFRTTPRRSTGETPFSLTYGTEAIIPLEVSFPTLKTTQVEAGNNDEALEEALDFTQERREAALIHLAQYQQTLANSRLKQVSPREFQVGDMVLRKNLGTMVDPTHGKLAANWEGPYLVIGKTETGAYFLRDGEGRDIQNSWNVSNLRLYYH